MALAFSYRRFSSKRQERGDSLRRQIEKAVRYAEEHGLTLDERSFDDLGKSAFKGLNAKEGELGLFLEAVESGTIPSDAWLLVESLDRISRQSVPKALDLFSRIIRTGVTLVTIDDGQQYSTANIDRNWTQLIIALSVMSRAHEESKTKQLRIKASWANKRAKAKDGHVMRATTPAWLSPNSSMTGWIVDDEKVQVVKRIFQLALQGNGGPVMAKLLNEEGVPILSQKAPRALLDEDGEPIVYKRLRQDKWTASKIIALMRNRALLGLHAPPGSEPIPNYYPQIIDAHTFQLVQDTVAGRRYLRAAYNGAVHNLFAGISHCSECHGRMKLTSMVTRKAAEDRDEFLKYIRCRNAIEGDCDAKVMPYLPIERAILRLLADDLSVQMASVKAEPQIDSTLALTGQRDDLKVRLDKLIELASLAPDVKAVAPKITALQAEIAKVEVRIAQVKPATYSNDQMRESAELFDQFKGFAGEMDVDLRRLVQSELRRVIDAVIFKPAQDGELPSVAVRYVDQLGGRYRFLTVLPDPQGGAAQKVRRKLPKTA